MNPSETKVRADEFLRQNQSYTFGRAVKIAVKERLYNLALQSNLDSFLQQRNWLVYKVICENEEDFNAGTIRDELLQKIKSISDKAESLQRIIQFDLVEFCSSKGKDMSKIVSLLKLQDQGVRIRK